jgi:serine protease Do
MADEQKKYSLRPFGFLVAISVAGVLLGGLWGERPGGERSSGIALAASAQKSFEANVFIGLAKKIVPSVVNISTVSTVKTSPFGMGGPDDLFRRFFEEFFKRHGRGEGGPGDSEDEDASPPQDKGSPRMPKAMSLGTGFIIDKEGLILTNNHVVADADEIKIAFTESPDETPSDGEVVGRDPELDVALIRVKSKREMTPVVLGDSDALEVGEYVIAVGNPFGAGHSVTHGIVSAKGRLAPDFPLASYVQTDAPINPGNSGGPLANLSGEVVGINNAIDQRAQGIGFAIPINLVKKVLPQLRTKGTVSRGYIGVLINELTPEIAEKFGVSRELKAPFVTHVYPGEPADKAGVKPYDVITEFNGKTVHSSAELIADVTAIPVGQSAPIKVLRGGKEKTLSIQISQRPGAKEAARTLKKGKGKRQSRVDVGMTLEDITSEIARDLGLPDKTAGVAVSTTTFGGPADRAGIIRGDVILEVDRKPVKGVDQFFSLVKEKKSYLLRVRRTDSSGRDVFAVIVLDLKREPKASGEGAEAH